MAAPVNTPLPFVFINCEVVPNTNMQVNVYYGENDSLLQQSGHRAYARAVQVIESRALTSVVVPPPIQQARYVPISPMQTGVCTVPGCFFKNAQSRTGPEGYPKLCNVHGLRYRKFFRLFPNQEWDPLLHPEHMYAIAEKRAAEALALTRMKLNFILNDPE